MTKRTPNTISTEIKSMRTTLVIFTILHFVYFLMAMLALNSNIMTVIWALLLLAFYISYMLFIWRLPLDIFDKWKETILACIFGIFAMWVFVQFNELENKR